MKTQKEFDEFITKDRTEVPYYSALYAWEACEEVLIKKLSNCMNCKYERSTEASSNNEQYPCFKCNNLSHWKMED